MSSVTRAFPSILVTASLTLAGCYAEAPRDPPGPGQDGEMTARSGGPTVRILHPGNGDTIANPVSFVIDTDAGIQRVSLDADGWVLDNWDPHHYSVVETTFLGVDTPRLITLTGFDAHGTPADTDRVVITVYNPGNNNGGGNDNGSLNVPYYYQYSNAHEPSATCGLTSAAMLLSYMKGVTIDPDTLYLDYGKAQGQSPGSLAQLYGWEGLYADSSYSGTRSMIKNQLDAGRPVLIHTFLTGAGHIVCVVGYDASGWIVNDPAGDWYQSCLLYTSDAADE